MSTVNNKLVDGNGLLAIKQYVDSQLSLFTHNINIEFNTTNSSNLIDICLTLVTTTSSKLTTVGSIISELQSLSLIADSTGNSLLVVNAGGYDGEHASEIYGIAPSTTSGTPLAFLIAEGAGQMVAISISTMRNIVIKDAMISGGDTSYLTSADLKTLNGVSLIGTGNITYDTAFSDSSTNAMQNKAIKEGLERGDVEVGKALQAKSIQAVSEESGTIQETPFIYQGTGTGNGAEVVDTSPVGKHLEKQGNTVVVNQKIMTYNSREAGGITFTGISSNITVSGTANTTDNFTFYQNSNLVAGHKYLIFNNSKYSLKITRNTPTTSSDLLSRSALVFEQNTGTLFIGLNITNGETYNDTFTTPLVDLTQWFGSDDNIPADLLVHPENFFRYYQGDLSYNAGTLVNANGRYLECGGRNVWDEEWELGYWDAASGTKQSGDNWGRCKNKIKVIPNGTYHLYSSDMTGSFGAILFYDANDNYIGYLQAECRNREFTVPSNACYLTFYSKIDNFTNGKFTISLYYPTGDGYSEYYPYEEPKVYDTGTEVLRKAGSVKDSKSPDGTITRRVGSVDLGSLSWTYSESDNQCWTAELNVKPQGNAISNSYSCVISTYQDLTVGQLSTHWQSWGSIPRIIVKNGSSADAPTGTLYYELATPTTEQGTPFAENIEINDYGTMGWKDTNNAFVEIPQGCKIFYPADYVLLVDSLNSYINGDVSALAKKSDLASDKSELQGVDTQLLNAIGGTLRQCLCVKESLDFDNTDFVDLGSLSWAYSSGEQMFYALFPDCKNFTLKMLDTYGYNPVMYSSQWVNMCIQKDDNGQLYIKNTSYTDATTFKNAMKGVLLAYEKAS